MTRIRADIVMDGSLEFTDKKAYSSTHDSYVNSVISFTNEADKEGRQVVHISYSSFFGKLHLIDVGHDLNLRQVKDLISYLRLVVSDHGAEVEKKRVKGNV